MQLAFGSPRATQANPEAMGWQGGIVG